jgi:tetratricopeptide (TPR) repeat protein
VLEEVWPAHQRLDRSLDNLMVQELVQQKRVVPQIEYMFKHVLTQVVVYETLLLQRRKQLHAMVGKAIESIYSDGLSSLYEVLAHHFELGEVWDKAVEYLIQAGIKARQNHVLKLAMNHFDKAKTILENHAPEVPWKARYDLYFERNEVLGDFGQWPTAYGELSTAYEIVRLEGDSVLVLQTLFARANAAFWGRMFEETINDLAELESLASKKPEVMLGVSAMQAMAFFMMEDVDMALEKENQTLELLELVPKSLHAVRASMIMGYFNRWRGDSERSATFLKFAMDKQKESASAGFYLVSLVNYSMAIVELGRYEEAIGIL